MNIFVSDTLQNLRNGLEERGIVPIIIITMM